MKKALALMLAMVMVFSLVACGKSAEEKPAEKAVDQKVGEEKLEEKNDAEEIDITVSLAAFDNVTASLAMRQMNSYVEDHPEVKLTYLDGANDAATQLSQVEQAVINGTQAVICLPVDAKQTQPIITACKDADVPLIGFVRPFEGCDTFIGNNNEVAGRIIAERVGELLNGKGSVGLIQGFLGQANTYERTDAIIETLEEKYPDVKIVLDGSSDWKRDKAMELVEAWLQSGTKFDAIIALNDDSGLGAQQALAAVGKEKDIPILSINGDPAGIAGVRDGILDCTAFAAPLAIADKALETAIEYVTGGHPDPLYLMEYELVTADNVENYKEFAEIAK